MKWPSVTHCCRRFSWFHKEPFCRASVIMRMKITVCSRWHYWGCRLRGLHFPFPETQIRTTYIRFRIVSFSFNKGKVTLFNVGSSFSYETGINGSWQCALHPPSLRQCSVLWIRVKSKQMLKSIKPGTSCSESSPLTNWATHSYH